MKLARIMSIILLSISASLFFAGCKEKCLKCNGVGKIPGICASCNGSGTVKIPQPSPTPFTCPHCGGSGAVTSVCLECGGSGKTK